jgi:hypothetical protein
MHSVRPREATNAAAGIADDMLAAGRGCRAEEGAAFHDEYGAPLCTKDAP